MRLELGTVIDNIDPQKNSRVKVSIPNVFPDDPELCPWVRCTTDKSPTAGWFQVDVPPIGAQCIVWFQNDDLNSGFILKYLPIPAQELLENYPASEGTISSNGNLIINNTSNNETIFHHATGTKITFSSDGSVNINVAKDLSITAHKISINGVSLAETVSKYNLNSGSVGINSGNTTIGGNNVNINGGSITVKGSSYNSYGAGKVHGMTIAQYQDTGTGATQKIFFAGTMNTNGSGTAPKVESPRIPETPARARPDSKGA